MNKRSERERERERERRREGNRTKDEEKTKEDARKTNNSGEKQIKWRMSKAGKMVDSH